LILEMLFMLEIAGADLSSPGFLSNGVTDADLKTVGNWPWLKERLASIVISSENVEQQDFRRLVGTKSIGEDLSEQLERSLRTSSLVTEGMKSAEKSETIESGNLAEGWKPDNLAAIEDLRVLILDQKNSEKVKQRSRFSASVAVLSQSDVCSSSTWRHGIACQGRWHSTATSYGSDCDMSRWSGSWQNDTPFCIIVDLPQLLLLASVVRVCADQSWQSQPYETTTGMKTSVDVELLRGAERTCRAASWRHSALLVSKWSANLSAVWLAWWTATKHTRLDRTWRCRSLRCF